MMGTGRENFTRKRGREPVRASHRGKGAGCWLMGFGSLLLAMLLALIGLLLPPFSLPDRLLGLPYQSLNAEMPSLSLGSGFSVSLTGGDSGAEFALQLSQVSQTDFETNKVEGKNWLAAAKHHLPYYLALQSSIYTLAFRDAAPEQLQFSLDLPRNAATAQALALYGWDGSEWRFIPATQAAGRAQGIARFLPQAVAIFQTIPTAPIVAVSYDIRQELTAEAASLVTLISPAGLKPSRQGSLIGSLAPGADADSAYLFLPLIGNYDDPRATDPETIELIIGNPALRDEHIAQIAAVASHNRFDGVFIDYRDLSSAARDDFSQFIAQLGASLSERGLRLGIAVPPARYKDGDWDTGAYDWRALGAAADYFKLRTAINPRSFGPEGSQSVNAMLRRAVDEVDRYKILLGLSAQSIREVAGVWTRIGYDEAIAGLGDVMLAAEHISETGSVEPGAKIRASLDGFEVLAGFDATLKAPFLDYLDATADRSARIWLTNAAALHHRMEHALSFGLAGVAFDDLLEDDLLPGLLQAILHYKTQAPLAASPSDLALRWSIEGSEGLLDQIITGLNEDLVVTLVAPDGNYAVNMAVIGMDEASESQRRGAALALFAPTATPTPTPTPTPTATPAPIVYVPPQNTGSASSSGSFAAVAPPPGSIRIEIGGHVENHIGGRAINAMRSAGMTWLKVQARFSRNGPPDMGQSIGKAHGNGFKIVVGTVGDPGELARGGQDYVHAYTDWLARIAGQGADAIEVWNEPNLDREWPRGQISGAAYAQMLAAAYQKIKAANPATMVISAAPAPTGVSDNPEQVMPDNTWLRQMVAAGGLDYLDCVGAHYNEGIIPPSQTSGDPRGDNYYTRYFYGMLNGYISITRKPICFTELGYLTPDGYPPLPSYFGWAQNVTVAQQAAWLAEAAALASQSGQVPLFIVWNIDFTRYDSDPQAGYAIIRRDGSCPACATLAQAR